MKIFSLSHFGIVAPQDVSPVAAETLAAPKLQRRIIDGNFHYQPGKPVKVAFFDADSTLRVSLSGSVSANGPRDVMLLPFVADKLRSLANEGYLIAIVSNQDGVRQGYVTLQDADAALAYTRDLIRRAGGETHYFDLAEARDENRKPDVGMAKRLETLLQEKFGPAAVIDKENSIMVGDSAYTKKDIDPATGEPGIDFSNADRLFARNYGVPFHYPADFFGWRARGIRRFDKKEEVEAFYEKNKNSDHFDQSRWAADVQKARLLTGAI